MCVLLVPSTFSNRRPTQRLQLQIKTQKHLTKIIKVNTRSNQLQQQLNIILENLELLRESRGAHCHEQTSYDSFWKRPDQTAADSEEETMFHLRAEAVALCRFWMTKFLRQRRMMTRIAKKMTLFIFLFRGRQQENRYWTTLCLLRSIIFSRNLQNIKLPRLDLPSFSGSNTEWISFYNFFNWAVIGNDQLTDSIKLQYWKSAVQGEASKMLTSITVTDDNFCVATVILQSWYLNERLILRGHIHGFVTHLSVSTVNTRLCLLNMGQPI